MSSRELLELIEFLPDESAYRTALRCGDWSRAEYREARLVNEMALSRADNGGTMPELVQSPLEEHAANAVDLYRIQKHAENLARLQGKTKGGD